MNIISKNYMDGRFLRQLEETERSLKCSAVMQGNTLNKLPVKSKT